MTLSSTLIIAEAGVNHDGCLDKALALVFAARRAGADIVKFQYFTAEATVSERASSAPYQTENAGIANQKAMLKGLELDLTSFEVVARACEECGIEFLATCFDWTETDKFVALGMRRLKVPSGEITNLLALRHLAGFGLPILLSTGMADFAEVERAVSVLRAEGCQDITVLQCTSLYPAPAETLNLLAMSTIGDRLGVPVGFSDHSLDDYASIGAVALGATVIEKHLTLDRDAPGPDHKASLDVPAFAEMVNRLRAIERARGDGIKRPHPDEVVVASLVRRSWHARRELLAGQTINNDDVALVRPLGGLAADSSPVGRRTSRSVLAGFPIMESDLVERAGGAD